MANLTLGGNFFPDWFFPRTQRVAFSFHSFANRLANGTLNWRPRIFRWLENFTALRELIFVLDGGDSHNMEELAFGTSTDVGAWYEGEIRARLRRAQEFGAWPNLTITFMYVRGPWTPVF
jgi:hypothetical protein